MWLDALVMNVDRTPRNPNLLVWHGRTVAHRPRRGAVPPARRRRPRGDGRAAVPGDRATTCCCRTRRRSPRPTRGSRRGGRRASTRRRRCVPEEWLRTAARRRTREYLRARLESGGVRARRPSVPEPPRSAVPVRAAARRAARRARRVRQRGRRRVLPAAAVPRGARRARRGRGCARSRPTSTPAPIRAQLDVLARDRRRRRRRAGRSRGWSRPSASTGSPRRRARSSSPAPVHTGLCDDPHALLDRLFATLVAVAGLRGDAALVRARRGAREDDARADVARAVRALVRRGAPASWREPNAMVARDRPAAARRADASCCSRASTTAASSFFTNLSSRKGREAADDPRAALVFPWLAMRAPGAS